MPPAVASSKIAGKTSWKEINKTQKASKELKMLKCVAKLQAESPKESKMEELLPKLTRPTISIAIPGSILENAQSAELRTYVAGQIARAACIFKIDEVIVFDDIGTRRPEDVGAPLVTETDPDAMIPARRSCVKMARILQFLECPQYLRQFFFPLHKDLQYAGLLNPLDTPHHLRQTDEFPFREGIVTDLQTKPGKSIVNVGLRRDVAVDRLLEAGLRVTVQLFPPKKGSKRPKRPKGRVVSPQAPEAASGRYWGYSVRIASSLSAVFSDGPYSEGYDLTIGTSDKGQNINAVVSERSFSSCSHALVVLGGLSGLEGALEADSLLQVDDPALLFDYYLNTCPDQGTRTIRTEEALLVTLALLRPLLMDKQTAG